MRTHHGPRPSAPATRARAKDSRSVVYLDSTAYAVMRAITASISLPQVYVCSIFTVPASARKLEVTWLGICELWRERCMVQISFFKSCQTTVPIIFWHRRANLGVAEEPCRGTLGHSLPPI